MRKHIARRRRDGSAVALAAGVLATSLLAAAPASAVGGGWVRVASPNAGPASSVNILLSVAASSASNAWAVGNRDHGLATLIEHWNGHNWVVSASPSGNGLLNGVAIVPHTTRAWAVGFHYPANTDSRTLIERWTGSAWVVVASPNPTGPNLPSYLNAVTARSSSDAWAVGSCRYTTTSLVLQKSIAMHWNGHTWSQVATRNPGGSTGTTVLADVTTVPATDDAWAVGQVIANGASHALVEHWNGSRWSVVASPSPNGAMLSGVTATSATNAWAVGQILNNGTFQTLVLHWNGHTWARVTSPNPGGAGGDSSLVHVIATSTTNTWAVGNYVRAGGSSRTLVEHWNGHTWTQQSSPNPAATGDVLADVTNIPGTAHAWAVGGIGRTLTLRH